MVRDDLLAKLWNGHDPLIAAPSLPPDCQGWNHDHRYLRELQPGVIVEVGSWKGASAVTMARTIHITATDACVLAVDTWRGSAEHWDEVPRNPWGVARLYDLFLSNVIHEGMAGYVVPLPLDSASAATLLALRNISASVVHIDAAHDFESCSADLRRWWNLLLPGGRMIVDDYGSSMWRDVKPAVDEFCNKVLHRGFEYHDAKCRFTKE